MIEKGYWAIVTYEAGLIGEKVKYWIPGEIPPRSERKRKADLRKIRQNENNAVRRVARILNENFPGRRGSALELSYSPEGIRKLGIDWDYDPQDEEHWDAVWEAAHHQLQLFIRRCIRACKKAGVELRYMGWTSDMRFDGKLQMQVHTRIHHHLVVNPEAEAICLRQWHLGACGGTRLKKEPDHTDFAQYLMDQVRRIGEKKKYIPSRNLRKPKESAPRIAPSGREVQPPKGAALIYRAPYNPGRPQYIRYILPGREENDETQEE